MPRCLVCKGKGTAQVKVTELVRAWDEGLGDQKTIRFYVEGEDEPMFMHCRESTVSVHEQKCSWCSGVGYMSKDEREAYKEWLAAWCRCEHPDPVPGYRYPIEKYMRHKDTYMYCSVCGKVIST